MLQAEPAMDMSQQEMMRDISLGIDGELNPILLLDHCIVCL
jgi:hypothetical protein